MTSTQQPAQALPIVDQNFPDTAALIDRRVRIVAGTGKDEEVFISSLRDRRCFVLLGEPGGGKSTVLGQEASAAGTTLVTARDFIRRAPAGMGGTAFIDALDEYRIEGVSSDRVDALATAIHTANVGRWRISCRAEDWRLDADTEAFNFLADGEAVCVVELLPLNDAEARLLLEHFGCTNLDTFLDKAERLGALGFAANPLSLKLLFSSTLSQRGWPKTRFELFDNAIKELAFEHNDRRKRNSRSNGRDILRAAGRMNLFLLITGAQSIWFANTAPPLLDRGRYLSVQDLELPGNLAANTLDTALFRGEGANFVPMHRTIAEFSAAQYLIEVIIGGPGVAALPLSRALSVIAGGDGAPPTELRGLFGWIVTHLAHRQKAHLVSKLLETDPMTALQYGDPAIYTVDQKRRLLKLMPKFVPHHGFPAGISLGGMASEELVPELSEILERAGAEGDLDLTVVEMLERGDPVPGLSPTYRSIVLDPGKPFWLRKRLYSLSVQLHEDPTAEGYHYMQCLNREAATSERVQLQLFIALNIVDKLSTAEVRTLLHDYAQLRPSSDVALLKPLGKALLRHVPRDLFDVPVNNWLPARHGHDRSDEVESELDKLLAALIEQGATCTAEQVWQWVENSRRTNFSPLGARVVDAISGRYGKDALWRASLLETIYRVNSGTRELVHLKFHALLVSLNEADFEAAWQMLADNPDNENLLVALVYSLRTVKAPALYDKCLAQLQSRGEHELEKVLKSPQVQPVVFPKMDPSTAAMDHFNQWLQDLRKKSVRLRQGMHLEELKSGASPYLNPSKGPGGEKGVAEMFAPDIASAMVAGFRVLASKYRVAPGTLKKHLEQGDLTAPLIAGVMQLVDVDMVDFKPDLSLAVHVLLTATNEIRNYETGDRVREWALRSVVSNPVQAVDFLVKLWKIDLAEGATSLPGIPFYKGTRGGGAAVFGAAIAQVMRAQPDMPPRALIGSLKTVVSCLSGEVLQALVDHALPLVQDGESRLIWRTAQMCMNPQKYAEWMLVDYPTGNLSNYMARAGFDGLGELLLPDDPVASCYYHVLLICLISRKYPKPLHGSGSLYAITSAGLGIKHAIRQLANNPSLEAGVALESFRSEASLEAWHADLAQAVISQAASRRDEEFAHPAPAQLSALLKNGPPQNAADLFAVIASELDRYQQELRTGDLNPWARYWNYAGQKLQGPRLENLCRDSLLETLRARLENYRINGAVPEAQHVGNTRADMLILSGAGAQVPVEVKRHMHGELWTAAGTQLQHYAQHTGAKGRGVYLVFWFGLERGKLPTRPGRRPMPATADELREYLVEDLPEQLRGTTEVVVLDVSPVRRPQ